MEDRYEPLFPPPPTSGNEYDDNWLQLSCLMPHTESIHFPTTTCQPYINISRLTIGRQRSIKPRYSLSLQYLTREAFAPEKQKRLSGVLVHHFVLHLQSGRLFKPFHPLFDWLLNGQYALGELDAVSIHHWSRLLQEQTSDSWGTSLSTQWRKVYEYTCLWPLCWFV